MKKLISFICLFFLPTFIARLIVNCFRGYKIEKGAKIGFSLILCDELYLSSTSLVGHLNLISVRKFLMHENNKIKHLNLIRVSLKFV